MIRFTVAAITVFVLLSFRTPVRQEEEMYPFSKWDEKTIEKAKTYTSNDKLSDLEREVIYYTNLCRLNPKLFADTYVKQYVEENGLKSNYVNSLFRDLKKPMKLDPLKFDPNLYACAKMHAENNGKKGLQGHQNFTARFKKYAPEYRTKGENCDYGNNRALDIVMSLLIDEDVSDLGHRHNMLEKAYKFTGVAYAPHKTYDHNVVMCFGGQ